MSSQRRRNANRLNALKSTGPKTALGKRASSLNAQKHGLLSSSLDTIACAAFQELQRWAMEMSYSAETASEIAKQLLAHRRVMDAYCQIYTSRGPEFTEVMAQGGGHVGKKLAWAEQVIGAQATGQAAAISDEEFDAIVNWLLGIGSAPTSLLKQLHNLERYQRSAAAKLLKATRRD